MSELRLDEPADGVHRVEDAYTNWYLVQGGERVTAVDAGVPSSWQSLERALPRIGRTLDDLAAVVLTHAHFDHLGFAERARSRLGTGHGPAWTGGIEAAVSAARAAGAA